jgi:hypothetical protein
MQNQTEASARFKISVMVITCSVEEKRRGILLQRERRRLEFSEKNKR